MLALLAWWPLRHSSTKSLDERMAWIVPTAQNSTARSSYANPSSTGLLSLEVASIHNEPRAFFPSSLPSSLPPTRTGDFFSLVRPHISTFTWLTKRTRSNNETLGNQLVQRQSLLSKFFPHCGHWTPTISLFRICKISANQQCAWHRCAIVPIRLPTLVPPFMLFSNGLAYIILLCVAIRLNEITQLYRLKARLPNGCHSAERVSSSDFLLPLLKDKATRPPE